MPTMDFIHAIIMLYVFFSKKFENEVEEQIDAIKEYEEKISLCICGQYYYNKCVKKTEVFS